MIGMKGKSLAIALAFAGLVPALSGGCSSARENDRRYAQYQNRESMYDYEYYDRDDSRQNRDEADHPANPSKHHYND